MPSDKEIDKAEVKVGLPAPRCNAHIMELYMLVCLLFQATYQMDVSTKKKKLDKKESTE